MTRFLSSESGAVTVDWVVLTAGIVGLGLATMTVVSSGVQDLGTDVDQTLTNSIISTSFADPSQQIASATTTRVTGYQTPTCSGAAYDPNSDQSLTEQGCTMSHFFIDTNFVMEDGSEVKVRVFFDVDAPNYSQSETHWSYIREEGSSDWGSPVTEDDLPDGVLDVARAQSLEIDPLTKFKGGF